MTEIPIVHAAGAYRVTVAAGALWQLGAIVGAVVPRRRLALITDDNVAPLIPAWLGDDPPEFSARLTVPAGEESKSREQWAELSDALLEHGFNRDSAVVAIGGGVVGDLAGFVAATYLRGVPIVQCPTTLLAMVDASVGGKVGVDTPSGKNLIGAFHAPSAVVADPTTLASLPEPEYRAGLAEAVKHGLIADAEYLRWIEVSADRIANREPETLTQLVRRSVEIKGGIVADDEREGGRRAILNAGHTVAHALEVVTGYGVRHGDAVAVGLVTEAELAELLGRARPGLARTVRETLVRLGLSAALPSQLGAADLISAMAVDKKNRGGEIRFALVAAPGEPADRDRWTVAASPAQIAAAIDRSR